MTSFDSTSPFRQAFKDDRDNFHGADRTWIALRVPQVDANPKLQRRIRAGEVDGRAARRLEQRALAAVRAFDRGEASARRGRRRAARVRGAARRAPRPHALRTPRCSEDAPWRSCDCEVCATVGIEVAIFRGTERNKRRGFHNLHVFAQAPRTGTRDGDGRAIDRSRMTKLEPPPTARYELRLPALAIRQNPRRTLYSFAVDGKKLPLFAAVSRVKRDAEHQLAGYQRAESIAHIRTIRRYLETADAVLPNALVVAFDSRVRFEPSAHATDGDGSRSGHLIVPVDEAETDDEKPGWIVDGQQRTAAIRDADVDSFPVYVTAFITDSVMEQRSQFILVNSTKPLPKGLIHELLPVTPAADLPLPLLKRRFPAQILDRLNYDDDSPSAGRIRTPTTTTGVIKDNSMLKMLAMSIEDGALYQWFDGEQRHWRHGGDARAAQALLDARSPSVFPDAWEAPPRRSRLVHGVGIVALGCLMDEICLPARRRAPNAPRNSRRSCARIGDQCAWTEGFWQFGAERSPALERTPEHAARHQGTQRPSRRRLPTGDRRRSPGRAVA